MARRIRTVFIVLFISYSVLGESCKACIKMDDRNKRHCRNNAVRHHGRRSRRPSPCLAVTWHDFAPIVLCGSRGAESERDRCPFVSVCLIELGSHTVQTYLGQLQENATHGFQRVMCMAHMGMANTANLSRLLHPESKRRDTAVFEPQITPDDVINDDGNADITQPINVIAVPFLRVIQKVSERSRCFEGYRSCLIVSARLSVDTCDFEPTKDPTVCSIPVSYIRRELLEESVVRTIVTMTYPPITTPLHSYCINPDNSSYNICETQKRNISYVASVMHLWHHIKSAIVMHLLDLTENISLIAIEISNRSPKWTRSNPSKHKTNYSSNTNLARLKASLLQKDIDRDTNFTDTISVTHNQLHTNMNYQLLPLRNLPRLHSFSPSLLHKPIFEIATLLVIICYLFNYLSSEYDGKKQKLFQWRNIYRPEKNCSENKKDTSISTSTVQSLSKLLPCSGRDSLHDIIHHPWIISYPARKNAALEQPEQAENQHSFPCEDHAGSRTAGCAQCCDLKTESGSVKSVAFPSAQGNLSRLSNQADIQVYPVKHFLPGATCNPSLDLAHVGYRLATLSALPAHVPVSRIKLANAGFYFWGQGDEVKCYNCQAQYSGWTSDDNPEDIHRRLSPSCSHIRQIEQELQELAAARSNEENWAGRHSTNGSAAANVPAHNGQNGHHPTSTEQTALGISATPVPNGISLEPPHHEGTTSTNRQNLEPSPAARAGYPRSIVSPDASPLSPSKTSSSMVRPPSNAGQNTKTSAPRGASPDTISNSNSRSEISSTAQGLHPSEATISRYPFPRSRLDLGLAVYPMYQTMASRRQSFSSWDDQQAPSLNNIILCGMFYAGYADCVRCFYCGVGLKHWTATDDVWDEHVRWRPGCQYLRAIKGDNFIRQIQIRLGISPSPSLQDTGAVNQNSSTNQGQQPNTSLNTASSEIVTIATPSTQPASSTTTAAINDPKAGAQPPVVGTTSISPGSVTTFSGFADRTSPSSASTSSPSSADRTLLTSTDNTSSNSAERTSLNSAHRTSPSLTRQMSAERTGAMPEPIVESSSAATSNQSTGQNGDSGNGNVAVLDNADASEQRHVEELRAENRALTERLHCRSCLVANINTILLPCGHFVLCDACAASVTSCPLCSVSIRATARVYMQ